MTPFKVDFFVVGAARCGTTSLYNYLNQHPKIFLPKVKECNYFSNVESLDQNAYSPPEKGKYYHMKIIKSFEGYNSLFNDAIDREIKGDISPSYLWDMTTAKNIYNYNEEAKIVIILRNPINRSYSHYLMHFNTGHEKNKKFEGAIRAKKVDVWGGGNMYLEMSLYYKQVKEYYKYFDDKNIHILIYEDWKKDIEKNMNNLYDFLNVNPVNDNHIDKIHNKTKNVKHRNVLNFFRHKKIKPIMNKVLPESLKEKIKGEFFESLEENKEINEETYHDLKNYFRKDVQNLEKLINEPLVLKWGLD